MSQFKMAYHSKIDSISSLPDVILQHILSYIPTKLAITTSLLSKRWRHVWCGTPCLSLDADSMTAVSVNETLSRYTAPKMMKFHLKTTKTQNIPHMDMWINFAMSHNVENLSLDLWAPYTFPDFFFINYSVKQLSIHFSYSYTSIPNCSVAWTALKKLSLRSCSLFDESMAKILSGCPLLESLTLYFCDKLKVLDLSKSVSLRTLKINSNVWVPGPTRIVAPHIHYLRLRNSVLPCSLVDVSSLTEANLSVFFFAISRTLNAQAMVLNMLEKMQNAEKLTFWESILQILSLAEIRSVPFPMLKVKDLTLETNIDQYVIPGVERVLQNSPHLQKLTIQTSNENTIPEYLLDRYLNLQGFMPGLCWRSKDGFFWNKYTSDLESKHVTSFLELMLKNTKTLKKMVVQLSDHYLKFQEVVTTLSHNNNNVSIVLSTEPKTTDEW